jgi:hypothetical protein
MLESGFAMFKSIKHALLDADHSFMFVRPPWPRRSAPVVFIVERFYE